jgi:hypothetical protein
MYLFKKIVMNKYYNRHFEDRMCKDFNYGKGYCHYGDKCKYLHIISNNEGLSKEDEQLIEYLELQMLSHMVDLQKYRLRKYFNHLLFNVIEKQNEQQQIKTYLKLCSILTIIIIILSIIFVIIYHYF